MTKFSAAISNDQSIHAALELSKNSWLLAIQVPGRDNPSLHPIKGGDADGLMAKLDAARRATRLGQVGRGQVAENFNQEQVHVRTKPQPRAKALIGRVFKVRLW